MPIFLYNFFQENFFRNIYTVDPDYLHFLSQINAYLEVKNLVPDLTWKLNKR